jgi:hypothetical protein
MVLLRDVLKTAALGAVHGSHVRQVNGRCKVSLRCMYVATVATVATVAAVATVLATVATIAVVGAVARNCYSCRNCRTSYRTCRNCHNCPRVVAWRISGVPLKTIFTTKNILLD